MEKHYHILNGDSLKEQFPPEIEGEIIVARECLVDGDVKSNNLDELFQLRARFISELYGDYSQQDYYRETVSEFEKIRAIPERSTINLWFEDDLFCQVNFWFTANLLFNTVQHDKIFLVRPKTHTQFGFGGLNTTELVKAYEERVPVNGMDKIARLWESYKNDDLNQLLSTARELKDIFPFILTAVEAHMERIPTETSMGRPAQTLLEIMEELETEEFGPVFREFNKRENIYGFGDLQVKKLFDDLKNNR